LGAPLDKVGRVMVEKDLSVPGHPEVFVIGDLAHVDQDGHMVPGVAQGALQGAKCAAFNILRLIEGDETAPFHYRDLGSMATIGRAAAVADIGPVKLSGFIAWLAWVALHIATLIGFKNRVLVFIQWIWAYFTHERGSRLIHGMVHAQFAEPAALPSMRGKELTRAMTSARAND
jgi:NADH dehydrogenase